MTTMTDEQLAEIRARCEAATEGPWEVGHKCEIYTRHYQVGPIGDLWEPADARFTAHAREDIPALLAEVERLRAEVERLRDAEGILNMVRGLPLLTSDIVDTVALTYCKGLWDVCTISDPYWTGHFGIGGTPEGALRETLDYMLEACHD